MMIGNWGPIGRLILVLLSVPSVALDILAD